MENRKISTGFGPGTGVTDSSDDGKQITGLPGNDNQLGSVFGSSYGSAGSYGSGSYGSGSYGSGANRGEVVSDDRGRLIEAVNLRRDPAELSVWRPTGVPVKAGSVGAVPFCRFSPYGDGREIVLSVTHDNRLYYRVEVTEGEENGEPVSVLLTTLPAMPILAVTSVNGIIRLLLRHSPDHYLTYDNTIAVTHHGAMPPLPELRLIATNYNTLYIPVESISLSGSSPATSGSQLTPADQRKLTDALAAAYRTLRNRASGMNSHLQPVFARYRLLDLAGNSIGVGPTVAVTPSPGFSAAGDVTMTSTDTLQTLNGGSLAGELYQLALIAPPSLPAPWNRLIRKAVIEVSAEIDPSDTSLSAPHSIRRDTPSGQVTVTCRLPGFTPGLTSATTLLDRRIRSGLQQPLYTVAEYNYPFDGGIATPGSLVVLPAADGHIPSPLTTAAAAVTSRSYSCAGEAGGLTILCDPATERFAGWSPACFIATRGNETDGEWRMASCVTLATPAGEKRVMSETVDTGHCPATLSGLLSYPSADALAIEISLQNSRGECWYSRFPLTPADGEDLAVYLSPGLAKIPVTPGSGVYQPKSDNIPASLENGVAEIYPSDDLGNRLDRRRISGGETRAILPLPRSGSGWDFSRLKLLFFGSEGVTCATINNKGMFHAVMAADFRVTASPLHVVNATGDNGGCILALLGDSLVSVSGQKFTTRLTGVTRRLGGRRAEAIGWEHTLGELWIACADNTLFRITPQGEAVREMIDGVTDLKTPLRFARHRGDLMIASAGGLHNLSVTKNSPQRRVLLRRGISTCRRLDTLRLGIFASTLNGTAILRGDRGTGIPEELLRLDLDGALNAPVALKVATPLRHNLETEISLTASSDLTIHPDLYIF